MKDFYCCGCFVSRHIKEFGGKANNKSYCNCCWPSREKAVKQAKAKANVKDVIQEVTKKPETGKSLVRKRAGDLMLNREIEQLNSLDCYYNEL